MSLQPLPLPPPISLDEARALVASHQAERDARHATADNRTEPAGIAEKLEKRFGLGSGYPAHIDILTALTTNQPPPEFIWQGFLAGTVGALTSPGATGKSFYALEAAIAVACGTEEGDLLDIKPHCYGPVLFLTAEDPADQTRDRLRSIGKILRPEIHQLVANDLRIIPLIGQRQNLVNETDLARASDAGEGCRLIVVDTLTRFHVADENSNAEMSAVVGQLERLAQETGAGVLFLHHVSKGAVLSGTGASQQAARGASALIDNARWGAALTNMTPAQAETLGVAQQDIWRFVALSATKINYGRAAPDRWYRRNDDGVLLPVHLLALPSSSTRRQPQHASKKRSVRQPREDF